MDWRATVLLLAACLTATSPAQTKKFTGAPEVFNTRARFGNTSSTATGEVYLTIHVTKYTSDRDHDAMQRVLESGGPQAFVEALRKAPAAGQIEVGKQTFPIGWAREQTDERSRVITLVVNQPVYFVGAGVPGAKSREGYDVAVVRLTMDSSGVGEGTMAAAARVKAGGPDGMSVDDYASEPIKLKRVVRRIQ